MTEYTYNSLDLVSHISYNGTKEVTYQYNKVGGLVQMDDWLGTTIFELDLLNRLTKVTDHKGNNGNPVFAQQMIDERSGSSTQVPDDISEANGARLSGEAADRARIQREAIDKARPSAIQKSAVISAVLPELPELLLPFLPFFSIPVNELDSFNEGLPSEGLIAFDSFCDDIFAAFIQYGTGFQNQIGTLMDLAIGFASDTICYTVEKISASEYFSSLRCDALAKIQADQEELRKSWYVYVLLDHRPSGTVIYVGMTSDAKRREEQHKNGVKGQIYQDLALFVLRSDLKDRTEARVCEQIYMTVFFPEIYNAHLNRVRSISQYKLSHNQTKLTALLNFVGDIAENELLSAMEEVEF